MNSKNNGIWDLHRLLFSYTDKTSLNTSDDKYVPLSNFRSYCIRRNIKKSCRNNKFKISAPIGNEKFKLPNGSYCLSYIQDYFKYIFKKYGEKTDSLSIIIK